MDECALLRRRIHSRNLKAVERFRRIGERNIDRADREPGLREESEEGPGSTRPRVRVPHGIATRLRFQKIKNTGLAWIRAGHERSPRWRRQRWNSGIQISSDTPTDQPRQTRQ